MHDYIKYLPNNVWPLRAFRPFPFESIVIGYPLESMMIEFSSVPIQTCLRMTHDWFEGSDLVRVSDVHELAFVLGVRRRGLPYLLASNVKPWMIT